jgi:hypothetical protein
MVKRKADLRTSGIQMSVHKYSDISLLKTLSRQHWNISHLQPFFPSIEKLFKTDDLDYPSEYGIRFQNEMSSILSANSIRTSSGQIKDVHRKISMILSPFKWMQGEYGVGFGLPKTSDQSKIVEHTLQNANTAAYVGSIIASALSHTKFPNFPEVYGIFNGMSEHHKIDISDDYEELCDRSWFSQNIGKTFEIELSNEIRSVAEFQYTRKVRSSLKLGEDDVLGDVAEIEGILPESENMGELKHIFEELDEESDTCSESSTVSTSYLFAIESCKCEEEEEEDEEDEEDDDSHSFAWAKFEHVPVQITVMEQCAGTIYDLMLKHSETEKHLAWLSQVIFALAYAQRVIGFVHNDLHANNVMYIPTELEYLNYNCGGILYRVPTFGYIIKIIDFERGIASIKLSGMKESKSFISNQFHINEEAGGQYNFDCYYIPKFPTIKPNPSFDLVRLATSLFWDLFPNGPDCEEYSENPVFSFFMKWLTLQDGSSVLFGKENKKHDRYHGFHLYKAITRYCKDNAVPRKEIETLKSFYMVDNVPTTETTYLIDI